ncbi:hypothetical protein [Clostridium tarantellae]|uniref:CBM6 domain-containing protein n=1 Tax=Clostridium tarantellae TaxID=39493 RepID=A0A6I1MKJ7_9CLOT|nr:hypothetical protein [Clostridium tarantellae]MPQ42968.1 hypothetical protein [Clostridium tarantellae]
MDINEYKFHPKAFEGINIPNLPNMPGLPNNSTSPTDNSETSTDSEATIVGKYQAGRGKFENGARLNIGTYFATNLGGKDDGSTTITVRVDKEDDYEFSIQYIATESRVFKIDVNNVTTGAIYRVEKTNGDTAKDAQVFITKVKLSVGENKVKFHGNTVDLAPDLGEIIIKTIVGSSSGGGNIPNLPINIPGIPSTTAPSTGTVPPTSPSTPSPQPSTLPEQPTYPILVGKYQSTTGILDNGVRLELDNKFVGRIGGPSDGSTTITVKVDKEGDYEFLVQYISAETREFKIKVNGESTNIIYTPEKTDGWEVKDAKIFTLMLSLKKGENDVKFHGNGTDYGPTLGEITVNIVKDTFLSTTFPRLVGKYQSTTGILDNGVRLELDNKFVGRIGGSSDGSTTITVKVDKEGDYEFLVQYISAETREFKIKVNGESTNIIYTPEKTDGWEAKDAKIFTIMLKLDPGENEVKFHGNGTDFAPKLGEITVNIVKDTFLSTTFPRTIGKYQSTTGILDNGVRLELDNKFVGRIGGESDGSTTIIVKVDKEGSYEFLVQYISAETRAFKIAVNGESTNKIYTPEKTGGWEAEDAKIFDLRLQLKAGENEVKFHGNGSDFAPKLGEITVNILKDTFDTTDTTDTNDTSNSQETPAPTNYPIFIGKFQAVEGVLSNGAKPELEGKIVGWIGGPDDGATTITVKVEKSGIYEFLVQYIVTDNRVFKVDVNNLNTGIIYTPENTATWTIKDSKIFKLRLKLDVGENKVKFHGNGTDYSPSFGEITVNMVKDSVNTTTLPSASYPMVVGKFQAAKGELANGAKLELDGKVAGWIGGPDDGATTITVKVDRAGAYEFLVQYVSGENRVFRVDVNGVSTDTIYRPEKTNGWSINDAANFKLTLQLKAGENKVKLHGNGVDYAPSFGEIIVNITETTFQLGGTIIDNSNKVLTFNAAQGILEGGAKLDEGTNLAGWIGGPSDGSSTIIVTVDNAGTYGVSIDYIGADDNRILAIDVNGINVSVDKCEKTNGWTLDDIKTFNTSLNLKSGENKIRFHGNGKDYGPSLGTIKIYSSKLMNTETNSVLSTYDIALGELSNGAMIDMSTTTLSLDELNSGQYIDTSTNFAMNLGGPNDGAASVVVSIEETAIYTLSIDYLSGDFERIFKMDINNNKSYKQYKVAKTKGWKKEDKEIFDVDVILNRGANIIKFYGDGVNKAPYLGKFKIKRFMRKVYANIATFGSAIINRGIIENIGGVGKGEVVLRVDIDNTGIYDFAIHYLANDYNKKLEIEVNGVSTGIRYDFEKTNSMAIIDEKIKIIKLQLSKGINIIRLFNK